MFRDLFRNAGQNGPIHSRPNHRGGEDYYDHTGPLGRSYDQGNGVKTLYDHNGPVATRYDREDGSSSTFFNR